MNWNKDYFKRLSTYSTLVTGVCSTIAASSNFMGLDSATASYLTMGCVLISVAFQTISFKTSQTV